MPKQTWYNLPAPKQERVLRAAMAEFGAEGFSQGSLNVIAREAGVAKGSLFQYFDDKLDLFRHVCERALGDVQQAMAERLEERRDGQPLFALLCELLTDWVAYFHEHPLQRGVAAATYFEIDPDVRSAVRAVANAGYLQTLRPLVELAARRGELRDDLDTDRLIALLVLVLPHAALAPHTPELDPVLGLHGLDAADAAAVAAGLLDTIERGSTPR
jgi:AcrR family transcriptional regulator